MIELKFARSNFSTSALHIMLLLSDLKAMIHLRPSQLSALIFKGVQYVA